MKIYPITIPGGTDTQVQYNNGGIFGGATGLTYNDGTSVTTATGLTVTSCAVLGANSAVFQPAVASETFFQVKLADGSTFVVGDTTNKDWEVTGTGVFGTADDLGIDLSNVTSATPGASVGMLKLSDKTGGASDTGGPYVSGFNVYNSAGIQGEFFQMWGATTDNTIFGGGVSSDAYRRFRIKTDGGMLWGGGTAVPDWEFFRQTSTVMQAEGNNAAIVRFALNNANAGSNADIGLNFRLAGATKWTIGVDKTNDNLIIADDYDLTPVRLALETTNGFLGLGGETAAETLIELTHATPYITLHNDTHEDTDGGRESRINFKGEQSGGEETTLARIQAQHDGAADDQKGELIFYTNDGSDGDTPTERLRIDSAGVFTLTPDADTDLTINLSGTTNSGVIKWMEDEDYVEFDDDIVFSGDAVGLPYGDMYTNTTIAVTISVASTPTEVKDATDDGFTSGEVHRVTFPTGGDEHYLAVDVAGRYLINWSISFAQNAPSTSIEVEGGVMVGGAAQNPGRAHRTLSNSTDTGNMGGTCVLDLAASAQVSLYVTNETNTTNIDVQHANLTVMMVGGT